ncbi:MAG: DNA mismatch repair protein MutS, partial [Clostridia bacterium]|nr:DNA mismatch repair protein MutS [Clostridia bacterium]
ISVVDKLFTRVGASDDLASGRSTFMVEMSEVANILANATSRSFLILDEIGRGTSTFDGLSIAWAVLEYILKNIGARTMFATHYHELTELEGKLPGVKNYSSDVRKKGEEIVFLRKIRRGEADGSYGVCVAALAGIPKAVTLRAEELSRQLEEAGLYAKSGKKGKKQPDVYEQDGMDLISYTASTVMQDELIEELKNLNVQELTPIEAMNILYRLHQKAEQRI